MHTYFDGGWFVAIVVTSSHAMGGGPRFGRGLVAGRFGARLPRAGFSTWHSVEHGFGPREPLEEVSGGPGAKSFLPLWIETCAVRYPPQLRCDVPQP
jgi:hypothetical protein